jgi:hypothetical protein
MRVIVTSLLASTATAAPVTYTVSHGKPLLANDPRP